jgi:RND family efflux transporter MFP subunit
MTRKIGLALLVLAIAAVGAFVLVATAPSIENIPPERLLTAVRVMTALPQTTSLTVHSQGTVEPRSETELVPEVSGPVVWVSPSLVSGGFFEKDDPLLRLDPRDYEAAVARARAALARATGEAEHASSELKRQRGLSAKNVASSSQLSNASRASTVGQASVDEARVSLEQAERDLGRCEIRAPFEGRVRNEHVDLGQFVSRGQSVAMLYATDFAEIRLPIADTQLAFLDLPSFRGDEIDGPPVTLRANFAGAEREWGGRIVRTEGEIDPKSRMVHVIARVADPYGSSNSEVGMAGQTPLVVGLFVRAEIEGRVAEDVIAVPRSAMRNDERILIVDADDRLRFRDVDVLRIQHDDVLIRMQLGPGERICVSPLQVVVDGMRVQPIEERAPQGPRA